jgi:hypothetical protein
MTTVRPLRSWMFVPGNSQRFLDKSFEVTADAVFLDLEDGVPPPDKAAARELVADALRRPAGTPLRFVRLKHDPTGDFFYACIAHPSSRGFFTHFTSEGVWLPANDWGHTAFGGGLTARQRGPCDISHVPGMPGFYTGTIRSGGTELLTGMSTDHWIGDPADPDNDTRLYSTLFSFGGLGPVHQAAPLLVRSNAQADRPDAYSFWVALLSPPGHLGRIIHASCEGFDGDRAAPQPADSWMICVDAGIPAEHTIREYRRIEGHRNGFDLAQDVDHQDALSWSASLWDAPHRTGAMETVCEQRKGRLGLPLFLPPREVCTNVPVPE